MNQAPDKEAHVSYKSSGGLRNAAEKDSLLHAQL